MVVASNRHHSVHILGKQMLKRGKCGSVKNVSFSPLSVKKPQTQTLMEQVGMLRHDYSSVTMKRKRDKFLLYPEN